MTIIGADAAVPIPVDVLGERAFVGRYVCDPSNPKCITAPELAGYRTAKKGVLLFFENDARDALGGAAAGKAMAQQAKPTLDAIGWPSDVPVHVAADFSVVGPGQEAAVLECVQAFAAVVGLPEGAYGDYDACQYLAQHGVKYLVQFGADPQGQRAPGPFATVYQGYPEIDLGGLSCDPLTACAADFGAWMPTRPEDTMILTKLHDGETVVVFLSESGYRKIGQNPQLLAWVEALPPGSYIDARSTPLPQNPPLKNLGPFTAQ